MMNPQIDELLQSFEASAKNTKGRYNEFLAHVYVVFDKQITLCRTDRMMNKYKKMRMEVLRYIVAHEKEIIKRLNK
jgi:DNA-binding winged helix-turn-helix (wHTH) protein